MELSIKGPHGMLDDRLKHFAVQLCGLSRGEDYVWDVVKDAALRYRSFDKSSEEATRHQSGILNALHEITKVFY
jgi:hypothetical protein